MKVIQESLDALRAFEGPLTEELRRVPGAFDLGQMPGRKKTEATTTAVCGYCSTGCALNLHLDAKGEAINLSPAADYPVNLGIACPKGWKALTPLAAPDRATTPFIRRQGRLVPTDWECASNEFCKRFKTILAEHGPESVAWLGTGQITTEELALLGAFAKFGGWA